MAMSREDIETWALEHGFRRTAKGELAAAHGSGNVVVSFTDQKVKTRVEMEGRSQSLGGAYLSSPLLKVENGVVSAIGLVSPFSAAVMNGSACPVWWSDELKEAYGIAPASAPGP